MRPVTVSVPGKLILMGEHAVVHGRPALVAAVDLRLRATLSSLPEPAEAGGPTAELLLPQMGHREAVAWSELRAYAAEAREAWERYDEAPHEADFRRVRGEDPAHVVKVGLGEAAAHLEDDRPVAIRVEVDSELPIGSGFGSSAAVAVGVVAGYLTLRGEAPSAARLERLALEVERRQHGRPSGVDSAAVVHGGFVWAEGREGGGLRIERLPAPEEPPPPLVAVDTGSPAQPTGEVVEAVWRRIREDRARYERVLDHMGDLTRSFRDRVFGGRAEPEELRDVIRAYEARLEELGVVPEGARRLVRRVEAEGGAAKISGAGALESPPGGPPSAGTLLVYHPEPERVAGWDFLDEFRVRRVRLGAAGYREESR